MACSGGAFGESGAALRQVDEVLRFASAMCEAADADEASACGGGCG